MARPSLEYPGLSQVGRHKGVCEVAWDQVEPDSPVSVWKALGLMDCHLQSAVQKQPFWGVPPFIIRACNYLFFITTRKYSGKITSKDESHHQITSKDSWLKICGMCVYTIIKPSKKLYCLNIHLWATATCSLMLPISSDMIRYSAPVFALPFQKWNIL